MNKLRKWVCVLVSLFLLVPVHYANAQEAPDFTLSEIANVSEDSVFTVTVRGMNIKNLYGFETVLTFDADKLVFLSASKKMPDGFDLHHVSDNQITYAYTKLGNAEGSNGDLDLVAFQFKAKSAGVAKIILNTVKIADPDAHTQLYPVNKEVSVTISEKGSESNDKNDHDDDHNDGSGSGSQPGEPIPKSEPQQVDLGVIRTENGKVVLTVDENKFNDKINRTAEKTVIIDLSVKGTAKEMAVFIPAASINKAMESGKEIAVIAGDARIKIGANDLDFNNISGNVEISIKDNGTPSVAGEFTPLTAALDINLKSGDRNIQVKEGIEVTLKGKGVKDYRKAGAYYYHPNKGIWEYVGGKADQNGTVTFIATHFSQYAAFEYNKTFKDVPKNHWANDFIGVVAAKHIIAGVDSEHYAPEKNLTRAEFAAMMTRLLGIKETEYKGEFRDVKAGAWYANAIQAAYENGILFGDGKNMNPERAITREEMAAIMVRVHAKMSGYKEEIIHQTSYADDRSISGWAKNAVANAQKLGLMIGKPGNRFAPSAHTTRAEAATAVYKFMSLNDLL